MDSPAKKKVIVVGAGPVGALAALYFSHAGWEVEVYELRGGLFFPSPFLNSSLFGFPD